MTGVALAINASAGSPAYAARAFRNALAGMKGWDGVPLAGRQGIRPMGGSAANIVTLSGSTITINLHAGEITPGWAAVTGTYDVALTAVETKTLTPADATNPRKDIVIGRVYDHDESASGLREYRSEYIAGVAGPSPAEPAVPTGAIKLATIDVPQSGGGSPVVTNNYTLTAAAGGILPVRTVTERNAISNPHTGQWVDRMDKGWPERYDGTAWRTNRTVITVDNLADITHPVTNQIAFHTTTRQFYVYTGTQWLRYIPLDHIQPTQTANTGTLPAGGNGVVIAEVTLADPGFSYYIRAEGQLDWGSASLAAGELMRATIVIDSSVYNTNLMSTGFGVTNGIGGNATQQPVAVPRRVSNPAFPAFTGAHTVRLIARKDTGGNAFIPAASTCTSLSVEILPVT